jgi:hypothetical protein
MLMVFIRPTILNDATQIGAATSDKYNKLRDQQIRQGERREVLPLLPGTQPPQLPEFDLTIPNPIQPSPPPAAPGTTTTPVP